MLNETRIEYLLEERHRLTAELDNWRLIDSFVPLRRRRKRNAVVFDLMKTNGRLVALTGIDWDAVAELGCTRGSSFSLASDWRDLKAKKPESLPTVTDVETDPFVKSWVESIQDLDDLAGWRLSVHCYRSELVGAVSERAGLGVSAVERAVEMSSLARAMYGLGCVSKDLALP